MIEQGDWAGPERESAGMRIDLTGATALITGGAAGIGRACAYVLAAAGASVVVADIDEDGAEETVRSINGFAVPCDLGDPGSIAAMRDRVIAVAGGVDILVNCAGMIRYRNRIADVSVEEWDRLLDVNLRGTFLVCRTFMQVLKDRGGGRIILLSSMAARVGGIEVGVHYTCSKAGLIGLTRSLAREGGPYGITANALAPGVILTGPVRQHTGPARERAYREQIPLGRLGEANDVAHAVLFLASPLTSYISGVVLDVNGGMYMA